MSSLRFQLSLRSFIPGLRPPLRTLGLNLASVSFRRPLSKGGRSAELRVQSYNKILRLSSFFGKIFQENFSALDYQRIRIGSK